MSSTVSDTFLVPLITFTDSPIPPTNGIATSTISPTRPTQAQTSVGLTQTSATLAQSERTSQTVSRAVPAVSL